MGMEAIYSPLTCKQINDERFRNSYESLNQELSQSTIVGYCNEPKIVSIGEKLW